MKALVTGGCGFIGSALVRRLLRDGHGVVNIDKLTYAGDIRTVAEAAARPGYFVRQIDIVDRAAVAETLSAHRPDVIFHLAAETHVDRSIDAADNFVRTNVQGTFSLLEATRAYLLGSRAPEAERFRFIHISTDEVHGSLGPEGQFSETSVYRPSSPYSATKAASDHLARAWHVTHGVPTVTLNLSNNYGPFQNREKLIPTIIRKALAGLPIPIYGRGENVRDWLYVEDAVEAMLLAAARAEPGSRYLVGGRAETRNIDLAHRICDSLDAMRTPRSGGSHRDLLTFVADRPGHDLRYAVECGLAERELGWRAEETLRSGLARTVEWYLGNVSWLGEPRSDDRLGLAHVQANAAENG
jgi:dTDP-glucose 4,6-dehydratase